MKLQDTSIEAIQERCINVVAEQINADPKTIDVDAEFDALGLDSVMAVSTTFHLEEFLGIELYPELLFEHTTIRKLANHLAGVSATARQHASVPTRAVA